MSLKIKLSLFLLIGFLFLYMTKVSAQIPAPNLYCIKNDTLLWSLPSVTCGIINGYNIYYSDTKSGPYQLLVTIANPNQTSYFHSTAGKYFYYYISTEANCLGQVSLSSDTLDNLDPPIIPIESVSVVGGKCQINWQNPISNKQLSFIIYRSTPNGTIPIDTVANVTSYLDAGSNPLVKSEVYYVLALDQCGNASIYDKPHYSMYTEYTIDTCKREMKLKWTPYQNWKNGVKEYVVYVSKNGAIPQPIDTVSANLTNAVIQNLNDGDQLCVYVSAIENNSNVTSSSSELCFKVKVPQPIKWELPYAATVQPNNSIDLKWSWNNDALLKAANVFSGNSTGSITSLTNFVLSSPLMFTNIFNVTNTNPSQGPVYFKIKTTDVCNDVTESKTISTIFLKGKANQDKTNSLSWEFPQQASTVVQNYEIYRIVGLNEALFQTNAPMDLTTIDKVDINKPEEERICYYVAANIKAIMPPNIVIEELVKSNTVCLNQFATMYFPNAIVPEGINNEFKPVSVFAQLGEYSLMIFDRWGQKIFETNDINVPWKGKNADQLLPGGLYVYYAKLKQPNGHIEEAKGSVMLIR
jgi:gliding motility-associated-like protein